MENTANAEKELTSEENLALAKIELGTDYTARIYVKDYMFKIQYPSVTEDQMIMIEEERQYLGLKNPSESLRFTAVMWATLEVVVKEVNIKEGSSYKKIDGTFSTVFKNMRNAKKMYEEVVTPLYLEYFKFEQKLNEEVDPLKK